MRPSHFRSMTLADRDRVTAYVAGAGVESCMVNFAQMYANQPTYDYRLLEHQGRLFLYNSFRETFFMPIGAPTSASELAAYSTALGGVAFHHATGEVDPGDRFTLSAHAGDAEYLYSTRALATMAAPAYRKKRNLVAAFRKAHPEACGRRLTAADVPACLRLAEAWGAGRRQPESTDQDAFFNECIRLEATGMRHCLGHFEVLGLDAYGLFVGDRLVAFDVFSGPVGGLIHVTYEKYDVSLPNSVPLLRQLASQYLLDAGYETFNFGRDIGLAGLRASKLSYHPERLLESRTVAPLAGVRLEVGI